MNLPNWILNDLRFSCYFKENNTETEESAEIAFFFKRDFEKYTTSKLFFCETSLSTIQTIHRIKTGEYGIIWDERFFHLYEKAVICAMAPSETNSFDDLKYLLKKNIFLTTAERLLYNKPMYAYAAINIFEQTEGESKQRNVKVENLERHCIIMKFFKWWTFFHEIGHELVNKAPHLVADFDNKLSFAIKISDSLDENTKSKNDDTNIFRTKLKEAGIIQSHEKRILDIKNSLTDVVAKEEVWCDIFAIEQMVKNAHDYAYDPKDIYLVLMLNYYITVLLHNTQYYFDFSKNEENYINQEKYVKEQAMRADLRVMYLSAMLSELYIKGTDLNIEEFDNKCIGSHYPILYRFTELEEDILQITNNLELRKHLIEGTSSFDELSKDMQIELKQNLSTFLGWSN